MLLAMGRNVIVSEETVRDLLEAHASLSAWYYELWAALRAANATANTPDDAARGAFVERLVVEFPEVAAIARTIHTPRMYVPAPPPAGSPTPVASAPPHVDEPATLVEPAPARVRGAMAAAAEEHAAPPSKPPPSEVPPPPPLVDPASVKYGQ
jgi:hypothetical protein